MNAAANAVAWWTSLYAANDIVQLAAAGGHILSIAYAAMHALRGDRAAILLTSNIASNDETSRVSKSMRPNRASIDITTVTRAHRHVISGLVFAVITGIAQLVAQLDYLPRSPIFWIKMFMLACLLANGRIIQMTARHAANDTTDRAQLVRLRHAALRSVTLWGVMILLGLLLTTVKP